MFAGDLRVLEGLCVFVPGQILGLLELILKILNVESSRTDKQDLTGIFAFHGTLFFPQEGVGWGWYGRTEFPFWRGCMPRSDLL